MPEIHTTLPKIPFTFEQWLQRTKRTMLPRSAELQVLDGHLDTYLRVPSGDSLIRLKTAFSNWRRKHGKGDEWLKSKRNDEMYAFSELHAVLYKDGDTDTAFGVPSFMGADLAHSRLGLLYLFGKLDCDDGIFSIITGGVLDMTDAGLTFGSSVGSAGAQNVIGKVQQGLSSGGRSAIEKAADKLDERAAANRPGQPAAAAASRAPAATEQTRTVSSRSLLDKRGQALNGNDKKLSDTIYDYFRKAWEYVVGQWDEHGGAALRSLCDYLTGRFLSDAVGEILGGSFELATSLYKLIESSFERYKAWAGSRKTQLMLGTPTAIVNGIERAMNIGVATNLYTALKSGAQLGMQIGSVGASTIVNFVTAIVEILVKTAWRLYEIRKLKKFFADAKGKWERREALQIHTRPFEFNAWFRDYALDVPVVSALALNSGLISKMHFLQMFAAENTPITEGQYAAGVNHLDELRGWSAEYISDSGYSISSSDEIVAHLAQPGEAPPDGALRKHLLKPFAAFLEGGLDNPVLGALGVS
ncbi:hypothetical protein [Paraburkholderia humisilvae]|uniref:Uncharacterized protein n=1 Tax=Paraburkholderia humisilvae TaxID=627669 RepID=A0A6J5DCV9_9BURK|nr:hypothetical protein [Paraburkholderia humisilvae]CAB3751121.1 hypothetical protein LMG29542_01418 [Paraburkholderia humisilvae]